MVGIIAIGIITIILGFVIGFALIGAILEGIFKNGERGGKYEKGINRKNYNSFSKKR